MVKQAEKKVKRNPLLPIFAIVLAVGFLVFGVIIANGLITGEIGKIQELMKFRSSPNKNVAIAGIAFAIWLTLMAIMYFVVALLAGKDPNQGPKLESSPLRKAKKRRRDWK